MPIVLNLKYKYCWPILEEVLSKNLNSASISKSILVFSEIKWYAFSLWELLSKYLEIEKKL